jgi:DNA-binding transcriptional LysR family regulator
LRQAAETLKVRQSTLSRHLRSIEKQLGVVLFERTNGGTRPTIIGLEFIETARHVLDEVDLALRRLKAHARGECGRLTIGVCAALSTGNLRADLAEYRRRLPEAEVRIVDRARAHLLFDLAANVIDVAIVMGGGFQWTDRSMPLWTERVVVALPEDHPLAGRPTIRWAELANDCLIVNQRDPGPEFHALLMAKIGHAGLGNIMEHDVGLDRLLSLVGAGLGVTLVAEGATGASYPGVTYREIHDETGPTRLAFAAYWRRDNKNPTLRPFLAMLRERYPDLAVPPDS